MDIEKNIEKSIKKLEFINQWIFNCDTKSSLVLTFLGVIVTIIFTSDIGHDMIATLHFRCADHISKSNIINLISLVCAIAFCVSIIISIYQLYQTLRGRVNPIIYEQQGLQLKSNIFFKTIQSRGFSEYETDTNSENEEQYLNDLNSQIYINSKIVESKFKHYNSSLKAILYGFGSFLFFVLLNS
ncbi:Pycsar system effector family protein [Bacteroides sp.]|uniref:Pycsar system effector family protein n=1 Tax=Bacteroides sp. TaxID=29523 RepID=UPI0025BFDB65|nr:Pycsar system effector family protein [Bacteroides sp.]